MEILPFEQAAKLLYTLNGQLNTEESLVKAAERIVNLERAYIVREGIRKEDDTLPERFLEEPLPDDCGESSGSIVELEPMLIEYYKSHNWDISTGIPTESKLLELNLEEVLKDLKNRQII
jgi:aldehyde:ferredoxin oxidoreductase